MSLPIEPPFPPMEANTRASLPADDGWQYEPKWDGFRCVVFRDGGDVHLQSKSCKPLERYFPEMVEAVAALKPKQFVIDAEIVVPVNGRLSFDDLLQRIHPAESRVRKLARETPASLIVFDLLATGAKTDLLARPLADRRPRLEDWTAKYFHGASSLELSPATTDLEVAERWLKELTGVDGVVAKRLDQPYVSGERTMVKVKRMRTADCVVGGFRWSSSSGKGKARALGSLLLGLYDDDGLLHHVGFSSGFSNQERKDLVAIVEPLMGPPGFTGNAPGGPSRWATERSAEWEPLRHELVVEIEYDHFTGGRFRHGTRFVRWRPDKAPEQCTFEQIEREGGSIEAIGM
ncbi:MAG TPA: ATP-dependent DNA ligase [Longimicrobiales bacterium]|nr:ATP-dependent DNA ligase [Longimicrobiales bacterium]